MRLDYAAVLPAAHAAMLALEKVVHDSGLDPRLLELVKLRASQINGCARCLEMHASDARALGEEQYRLDLIAAWPEADSFSPRERAALAWCEALTLIAETHASDALYEDLARNFEPAEIAVLTLAITTINSWNRFNISLRVPTGGYVSRRTPSARPAG